MNAFDPAVADRYLAAGASFVLVGADVALLARGSEALAARFIADDGAQRASTDPRDRETALDAETAGYPAVSTSGCSLAVGQTRSSRATPIFESAMP